MEFLPLASIAVVASLSLTGCASSPSVEQQTTLIEYDNCLEFEIARANQITSTSGTSTRTLLPSLPERFGFRNDFENFKDYAEIISNCSQFRP